MTEPLNIMSWNIHGYRQKICGQLVSKFNDDDFINVLAKFDIFGLIHAGPDSDIEVPGYKIHRSIRPKSVNATRYSGGIVVYVKKYVA